MRPQVLFSLWNFWIANSPRGSYTNTMTEELLYESFDELYDMLEQRTEGDPI